MIISLLSTLIILFSTDILLANQLIVTMHYDNNNTFILYYNLTSNVSYYLTFRIIEHEQIELGLFPSDIRENTLHIPNDYESTNTTAYLFIICFHFIHRLNEIDIQCKDIRLMKLETSKMPVPSYKPLFVPMMYALSILMLLPMIIQHRRRKQVQSVERRKQLRRLSMTIVQDHPDILANLVKRASVSLKTLPTTMDLLSIPSTKTILDDLDENIPFTKTNPHIFIDQHHDDIEVTADDCIAHLLDSTPWNSTPTNDDQSSSMISSNDERKTSNGSCTINLYRSNPAFIESEV